MSCKSGTYYFNKDTVALNPDRDGFKPTTEWGVTWMGKGDNVRLTNEGMEVRMLRSDKRGADGRYYGVGAVVTSKRLWRRGKITARMRIGPKQAPGVVTSFISMSKIGDEIDFEWLAGKDGNSVTVNWFARGIAEYGRDSVCPVNDVRYSFHDYTVEWTADRITWSIDGNVCKSISKWDYPRPYGHLFPEQNPNIQFGIWDGGMGAQGTRDWAGGGFAVWIIYLRANQFRRRLFNRLRSLGRQLRVWLHR